MARSIPIFKIFYNKTVFFLASGSVLFFIMASFFHDGMDTTRSLQSYIVPIFIGAFVGILVGMMKSRLELERLRDEEFFLNIIETLAVTLDERDNYTHGHSRRVTAMALHLGAKIGLRMEKLQELKLGALLHDIGKIGMADSILLKPGKLTGEEFSIKEKHPEVGARILARMRDKRILEVVKCVRNHHERYDGKGYPDSLQGNNIPFMARIVALADSFDAMTTERPYSKALTTEDAVEEILKESGKQFDPILVERFIDLMGDKKNPKRCPLRNTCNLFVKIKEREISQAYEMQYCRANYEGCQRLILSEKGEAVPDVLLPDGEIL